MPAPLCHRNRDVVTIPPAFTKLSGSAGCFVDVEERGIRYDLLFAVDGGNIDVTKLFTPGEIGWIAS